MTCYSVEPIDWIFAKDYIFFPFAKYMSENLGKNLSSKYINMSVNTVINVLIMLTIPPQMHLKHLQKIQLKNQLD